MSERDRLMDEGKGVQEQMRRRIGQVRQRYARLFDINQSEVQGTVLAPDEMEIDVFLRDVLSQDVAERLRVLRKEFAFELALRRVALERLDRSFLQPIAVERITLCSLSSDGRSVSTFRLCHLSELLKKRVTEVYALLQDGVASAVETASQRIAISSAEAAEVETADRAVVDSPGGARLEESLPVAARNAMGHVGTTASMQAKIEQRQRSRAEWQERWNRVLNSRPPVDWEDPNDVANIEYSSTHTGEYMLKISPDFTVKPEQRLTALKKKREMVFLEEAMYRLQVDFNRHLLAFRGLKLRLIRRIVAMDTEVRAITERLGDTFTPFTARVTHEEWPELARLFTCEMLDAFERGRKRILQRAGGQDLLDDAGEGAEGAEVSSESIGDEDHADDPLSDVEEVAEGTVPATASADGTVAGGADAGGKGSAVIRAARAKAVSAAQVAGATAAEAVSSAALDNGYGVIEKLEKLGGGEVQSPEPYDEDDAEGRLLWRVLAYIDTIERLARGKDSGESLAASLLTRDGSIRASMLCIPGLCERLAEVDSLAVNQAVLLRGEMGAEFSWHSCIDRWDTSSFPTGSKRTDALSGRSQGAGEEDVGSISRRDAETVDALVKSVGDVVGRVFKDAIHIQKQTMQAQGHVASAHDASGMFGSQASVRNAKSNDLQLDVPVGQDLVEIGNVMAQSMNIPLNSVQRFHDDRERQRLLCRRHTLVLQMRQFIELFDRAVCDLRRERFRLDADLKTAELRFLVMFQELMLLNEFEKRDNSLLQKVTSKKAEMEEVESRKQTVFARLRGKKEEAAELNRKSQRLMDRLLAVILTGTPLGDALLRVFHKRMPRRARNAKAAAGDSDGEDSESGFDSELSEHDPNIMYDDVLEDGSASDGSEDGDGVPGDCSPELYDTVCELRNEHLDIADARAEIQKAVDVLSKGRSALVRREEVIVAGLEAAERDIQAFQVEKQRKLNELGVMVRLRLSQVMSVTDEGNISDFGHSLIFGRDGLRILAHRIDELRREKEEHRGEMSGLRRQHAALSRQLKVGQQRVQQLDAKCASVQILKFGQLVDLEQLEELAVNTRAEELKGLLYQQEETLSTEMKGVQADLEEAKVELSAATRTNTQLLQALASLTERQHSLEQDLNAKQTSVVKDVKVATQRAEEVAVRSSMRRVSEQQQDRIEALTGEILALKSKRTGLVTIMESLRHEREAVSMGHGVTSGERPESEGQFMRSKRVAAAAHAALGTRRNPREWPLIDRRCTGCHTSDQNSQSKRSVYRSINFRVNVSLAVRISRLVGLTHIPFFPQYNNPSHDFRFLPFRENGKDWLHPAAVAEGQIRSRYVRTIRWGRFLLHFPPLVG